MKLPGRPAIDVFVFSLPRCLENGVAENVPFGGRFWLHFRPQNDPTIDPKVEKVRSVRSFSLKSLVGQVILLVLLVLLVSSSGSSRGGCAQSSGGPWHPSESKGGTPEPEGTSQAPGPRPQAPTPSHHQLFNFGAGGMRR